MNQTLRKHTYTEEDRLTEERWKLACEGSNAGTWRRNVRSGEEEWSSIYYQLYGLSPSEVKASFETWLGCVHPEDREGLLRQHEVLREQPNSELSNEFRIIRSGDVRWIHERGRNIYDSSGELIEMIGIAIDITERKLAEEELKNALKRKNDLLAIIGHELMGPLAVVQSAARLSRKKDGEQREMILDTLEERISALIQLCRGLLDVSLVNDGKLVLHKQPCDLKHLAEDALRQNRLFFEDKKQIITSQLPPESIVVDVDPTRISQIFNNLISNACKYTSEEGKIELQMEVEPHNVRITVSDNGQGFTPEVKDKIFDFYFQAQQKKKLREPGIGIGLGIVKGLVEAHGGSIEAHSPGPDRGSEFIVKLPRQDSEVRASGV